MVSARAKIDALEAAADDRELTPLSWWIGERAHDAAFGELEGAEDVEVQAGRLVRLRGLEVKLLTESPDRFALWCEEGVLDL